MNALYDVSHGRHVRHGRDDRQHGKDCAKEDPNEAS